MVFSGGAAFRHIVWRVVCALESGIWLAWASKRAQKTDVLFPPAKMNECPLKGGDHSKRTFAVSFRGSSSLKQLDRFEESKLMEK